MTADTFEIVADLEEYLILFIRIGNIIVFTKRAEGFFVAVCFQPKTCNLADSFFYTLFVTVVPGG
jgi:hypothetical protein